MSSQQSAHLVFRWKANKLKASEGRCEKMHSCVCVMSSFFLLLPGCQWCIPPTQFSTFRFIQRKKNALESPEICVHNAESSRVQPEEKRRRKSKERASFSTPVLTATEARPQKKYRSFHKILNAKNTETARAITGSMPRKAWNYVTSFILLFALGRATNDAT